MNRSRSADFQPRASLGSVVQSEAQHFYGRFVVWETASCSGGLAQPRIQRLNPVGRVYDFPELVGEGDSRVRMNALLPREHVRALIFPVSLSASGGGPVFPPPLTCLKRARSRKLLLGVVCAVNGLQLARDGLAFLAGQNAGRMASQRNEAGLSGGIRKDGRDRLGEGKERNDMLPASLSASGGGPVFPPSLTSPAAWLASRGRFIRALVKPGIQDAFRERLFSASSAPPLSNNPSASFGLRLVGSRPESPLPIAA